MYGYGCVCINFFALCSLYSQIKPFAERLQLKLTQMYHKVTYLDVKASRSSNPRSEDQASDSDTC